MFLFPFFYFFFLEFLFTCFVRVFHVLFLHGVWHVFFTRVFLIGFFYGFVQGITRFVTGFLIQSPCGGR